MSLTKFFATRATIAAMLYRNAESGEGSANTAAPTEPVADAPKLTAAEKRTKQIDILTKRIDADTVKLAELKLESETSERLAGVGEGTVITARIGRAETSKNVVAVVLGVKEDETTGAKRFKITYGQGFEQDTAVIQPSQIVSVESGAGAVAPAETVAPTVQEIAAAAQAAPLVDEYDRPINADGTLIG